MTQRRIDGEEGYKNGRVGDEKIIVTDKNIDQRVMI